MKWYNRLNRDNYPKHEQPDTTNRQSHRHMSPKAQKMSKNNKRPYILFGRPV